VPRAATFSAEFLGCKVSQTDVEALRARLARDGLLEAEGRADVHVVNGCCVTNEALAKTRQAVRRALAAGAGQVVVTGCAANLASGHLRDLGPRVHVVARPSEEAPAAVADLLARLGCRGGGAGSARRTRARAFLKVQDGCSFRCSFCVIPQVRGATRSRPLSEIVAEARARVAAGHRELVLTGVNIGLYRDRAAGARLAEVVAAVASESGAERVRLSSIEVDHLEPRLLDVLGGQLAVMPHLHVPLQSGDDGVLRAMRRRYDAARYLRRIAEARLALPGLHVTADVLVGFPAEDEAAFARTLEVVAAAGLGGVHAFPYSPRPGTASAEDDPVPPSVKRERSSRLRALADAAGVAHRAAKVGAADEVLVEQVEDGVARGYGRDYTPWRIVGDAAPGAIVRVVGVRAGAGHVEGRLVA
jgi:threonylcarbamoyladenosine tRNA methylthiotransferase MtaB